MDHMIPLLFEEYTRHLDTKQVKRLSQNPNIQFQRLVELVGKDVALEIWDGALEEGAEWEEACFRAGLRAGMELTIELLLL